MLISDPAWDPTATPSRYFELIDRRGEALYLVFGTNHPLGVDKMKAALWDVDPVNGVGFRDPRDEQHETLFDVNEPDLAPLGRLLLPQIAAAGADGVRVRTLQQFALHETVFRPQHVITSLLPLRECGRIQVNPAKGRLQSSSFVRVPPASA
ncbi:hypothetical protein [Actinokineospora sp. UTMC 2448]|uniref:hypothetical protein n=1 Tax=Actinokineospora sp. UTMC 2448 TaxID=2268449 RepID=UPI002164AE0A|nr:hypothetical protein [Actinokineospora sp. UTMC 2448]UVS78425.1 hypothetical protein Actkin_02158 [Actinokineospora sp. UTMC 2448]